MYSMEKRLDDHRRSVGLMSFWPTGTATEEHNVVDVNNSNGINNSFNTQNNLNNPSQPQPPPQQQQNNFAFDDFFRKSAVLGPNSSPVTTSAKNNNQPTAPSTTTATGYLSSPLGSKLTNTNATECSTPVNKENANDYNLI